MKKALFFVSYCFFLYSFSACFAQIQLNPSPTRVVGQDTLTQGAPNLVEGREFNSPQGVALDLSQNPPILYVADTGNNRVLGFRNAQGAGNGQKADLVIGQVDFLTTGAQGPPRQGGGQFRSTGLTAPVGLAVDAAGNLYVVDAGNNRILRFPKPFSQTNLAPDLVIGQTGLNGFAPNPNGASATTLALTSGSNIFQAYIALDPRTGDLFAADPGNNRVLRYPAALLGSNAKNGPAADLVLGQLDFATTTRNTDPNSVNGFAAPTGLAFDQSGHLFVSESQAGVRSRVLVYTNPSRSGQPATRIIGVVPSNVNPQPLPVSEQQFAGSVSGLFSINNGLGVADTFNNRLLVFRPVDAFSSDVLSQRAQLVVGQPDFSSSALNQGFPEAGADRLFGPTAAAASGTELYVADTNNNRVLVLPYSGSAVGSATRVFGQDQFNFNAPNLVEGKEFRFQSGGQGSPEAGIVADLTSNPPHLYVSDTFNHRVLGYKDLRTIKAGDRADIVIGQPDFSHTVLNYPSGDVNVPTASSLFLPTGLTLDPAGNLYVADSGNGRVLRFANPFTAPQS
ncbi:MAG: NHL repeat-containing protein, partial [Acidobacteriota bacterium]|nr:NHL repeat-containing protein [Acidobacteriota bacterium]